MEDYRPLQLLRFSHQEFDGRFEINFGFVYPYQEDRVWGYLYFYRKPKILSNHLSVVKVFPLSLWLVLGLVVVMVTVLFRFQVFFYHKVLSQNQLLSGKIRTLDVVFKVISTLTEPEALDLFPAWCAGN